MLRQFGIKGQLISIVTISVVVGIVLLIAICIRTATSEIDSSFKHDMDVKQTGFAGILALNGEGLMGTAAAVASDPRLKQGLGPAGGREAIRPLIIDLYAAVKAGNSTVQSLEVTNAAGIVLVRGHAPEIFGDDKSRLELFAGALRTRTPQSGMGVSLRTQSLTLDAVYPVMSGGTLLGLVKVGSYPNKDLLIQCKKAMGVDIAVIDSKNGREFGSTLDGAGAVIDRISTRMTRVTLGGFEYDAARYPLVFKGKYVAGGEVILFTRTDVLTGITRSITINMVLAGIAMLVAIIITVTIFIQRKLKPLPNLIEAIGKIAGGDLTAEAIQMSQDELGDIARMFNGMAENLCLVIVALSDMTGKIITFADELSANVDRQSGFSTQLSSSAVEISSTMEEFSSTASQIALHSQSVVEQADKTLEDSKTGAAEVENLTFKVNDISQNIQANLDEIVELGKKSKEINKVMAIINNIANQTKLIAFNAALEAASAGEAGKRFGVVAVEIRRLADSVVESTSEIEGKISEILDSVNRLVMSSEKSFQLTREGREYAARTVAMLVDSVDGVEEITCAARQISLSTQQQQIASSQVVFALKDIEQGVRHSSTSILHINSIVKELVVMSGDLKRIMGRFNLAEKGAP
ncbi:MAG: methyl-accepting chemotaxis protein [Desulfuromonadales bacterium]